MEKVKELIEKADSEMGEEQKEGNGNGMQIDFLDNFGGAN